MAWYPRGETCGGLDAHSCSSIIDPESTPFLVSLAELHYGSWRFLSWMGTEIFLVRHGYIGGQDLSNNLAAASTNEMVGAKLTNVVNYQAAHFSGQWVLPPQWDCNGALLRTSIIMLKNDYLLVITRVVMMQKQPSKAHPSWLIENKWTLRWLLNGWMIKDLEPGRILWSLAEYWSQNGKSHDMVAMGPLSVKIELDHWGASWLKRKKWAGIP